MEKIYNQTGELILTLPQQIKILGDAAKNSSFTVAELSKGLNSIYPPKNTVNIRNKLIHKIDTQKNRFANYKTIVKWMQVNI